MVGSVERRKARNESTLLTPIPNSIDEISEGDRFVWTLRREGLTWAEIQRRWEARFRTRVSASTLPNRHQRLKNVLPLFTANDDRIMLKCKEELEGTFEREKWAMVAEYMERKGADRFSAQGVEKRFSQIVDAQKQALARPRLGRAYADREARDEGEESYAEEAASATRCANKFTLIHSSELESEDGDGDDNDQDDEGMQEMLDVKSESADREFDARVQSSADYGDNDDDDTGTYEDCMKDEQDSASDSFRQGTFFEPA